jgi:predicted nucleic acid-binding Zn ribbon protein
MEEISKILPLIFKGQVRRSDPRMVEILAPLWPLVAGKPMARQSRPVAFEDGTLTLECDCTSWSSEMRRMSDDIRARINQYLGVPAVRKLKIRCVSGSMTATPLPDKSQFN